MTKTQYTIGLTAVRRLAGVVMLYFSASALYADSVAYTYSYTGMPFTQFDGDSYGTSDFVSGTITLSAPLPESDSAMTSYSFEVIALSFSDGVQTIDTLDAADTIEFGTSNGQIVKWDLGILTGVANDEINTQYSTHMGMDNFDEGALSAGDYGLASYDPGQWTTASAPEPAAITMMSSAVVLFSCLKPRRSREKG